MKVSLFTQCMVDMFEPQVATAAVEVLTRLGCDVDYPRDQVCCGQPLTSQGWDSKAKPMMKNMIETFEGSDVVVGLAGSCVFEVKEYPEFLADEPDWAARARSFADKTYEFTEFIVDVLGATDVAAISPVPYKLTYHKSCHTTRGLGVLRQPLALIDAMPGAEFVELPHAERCCGFGGVFCVKEPIISGEMAVEKARCFVKSGGDILTGVDMACLMNIKGAVERLKDEGECPQNLRVMHIAELLAGRA